MKKMLFLVVLALAVTGCSSIQYNNARKGVRLSEAEPLKIYPMQAEIEVGEVIFLLQTTKTNVWYFIAKR